MKNQLARAKVVNAALAITKDTAIAPSQYELQLLEKYVLGALTIEKVIALLEEENLLQAIS